MACMVYGAVCQSQWIYVSVLTYFCSSMSVLMLQLMFTFYHIVLRVCVWVSVCTYSAVRGPACAGWGERWWWGFSLWHRQSWSQSLSHWSAWRELGQRGSQLATLHPNNWRSRIPCILLPSMPTLSLYLHFWMNSSLKQHGTTYQQS